MSVIASSSPLRLERTHARGFWAVAFAFAAVMGFTTIPTSLWPIYQARDGFSSLTVTVVFATYAVGVALSLFAAGHLSDWHGRRRVLITALSFNVVAAAIFLLSSALPAAAGGTPAERARRRRRDRHRDRLAERAGGAPRAPPRRCAARSSSRPPPTSAASRSARCSAARSRSGSRSRWSSRSPSRSCCC